MAVVEVCARLCGPEARAALFMPRPTGLQLVWSCRIEQADLELSLQLDELEWPILEAGGALVVPHDPARLLLPALTCGRLVGLLALRPVPSLADFPRAHVPTLAALLGQALMPAKPTRAALRATPRTNDARRLYEREQLVALLERHRWNVARVARALGRSRMTVYNRLRRLGIERQRIQRRSPGAPADRRNE